MPAVSDTTVPDAGEASGSERTTVLGQRYEILGLLGTGGMGAVYRARDLELGEVIALKMIRPELASSPDVIATFRREVRHARRVTHRNIARTFDLGEADGFRFLTMELIEGHALADRHEPATPMEEAAVVDVALALCDGVAAAHDAGILHLDLKPANVMIADDGRIVVTDFGVARAVGEIADTVSGTWAYMAPEQAEATAPVDGRADQYAIGTILFELITGRLPFPGAALAGLVARLTTPPPDPRTLVPKIDDRLASTIMRCLARDRDERFDSVREVAATLRRRTSTHPVPPPNPIVAGGRKVAHLPTLALMPLRTAAGPDAGFADDLIDALHDRLATIDQLRLTPRGAGPRTGVSPERGREFAALLGAHVVVEGSLRPSAPEVPGTRRLAMRVTGVVDGLTIAAVRVDGTTSELARLVELAAAAIADALGTPRPIATRVLADPETLDLYLRGRREYVRFQPGANARAVELLRRAVDRSPDDPVALSAYAMAMVRQLGVGEAVIGQLARAREAADRARAVAPALVETQVACAMVTLHEGEPVAAARLAADAVVRGARAADAHDLAARLLYEAGALDLAAAHAEHALHHEPRLASTRYLALRARALQGDWEDAVRVLTGPRDPGSAFGYWADRIRLSLWCGSTAWIDGLPPGDFDGLDDGERAVAAAACELVVTRRVPASIAGALARATRSRRLTPRTRGFFRQLAAETAAHVGDLPGAIAAILGSVELGLFDAPWLEACPVLACVRDAPEIAAARAEVSARATAVIRAFSRA